MLVYNTIDDLRDQLRLYKKAENMIGFVPTMGALHQGHLQLVKESMNSCDYTVVSIFVNPIQFNNSEDFAKYPNTVEDDLKALKSLGVDVVFLPTVDEMYESPTTMTMSFGELETKMEGAFRPGHFSGVGVVVSKLFHIVQPDVAFFGQKDLQQLAVIKLLVQNLNFPIKIVGVPTVREKNGLAMSSRNMRLSVTERGEAGFIYDTLTSIRDEIKQTGVTQNLFVHAKDNLSAKGFDVEYLEMVHTDDLEVINVYKPNVTALCIAANFGGVRLIDNLVF